MRLSGHLALLSTLSEKNGSNIEPPLLSLNFNTKNNINYRKVISWTSKNSPRKPRIYSHSNYQLIKDGKSDQEIKDILSDVIPELIKNQKKGITGRGFLGAPTVWAASFSPEKHQQAVSGKPSKEIPETDKTPWKMWLDTSLFLLSIVAIMNAIFGFSGTQTSYGLTTLLSVSFIGGLAMYTPYHYIYRHNNKPKEERPKWWFSMTIITLSFIAWFALFSLTAFFQLT